MEYVGLIRRRACMHVRNHPSILLLSNLLPTLSRSRHENGKGMGLGGGGQKETKELKKEKKDL